MGGIGVIPKELGVILAHSGGKLANSRSNLAWGGGRNLGQALRAWAAVGDTGGDPLWGTPLKGIPLKESRPCEHEALRQSKHVAPRRPSTTPCTGSGASEATKPCTSSGASAKSSFAVGALRKKGYH